MTKPIQAPGVIFMPNMQAYCPVCGPFCAEVDPEPHIGYIVFINSFGEKAFSICTGCFVMAADALEEHEATKQNVSADNSLALQA